MGRSGEGQVRTRALPGVSLLVETEVGATVIVVDLKYLCLSLITTEFIPVPEPDLSLSVLILSLCMMFPLYPPSLPPSSPVSCQL